jgi:hypothetical protein
MAAKRGEGVEWSGVAAAFEPDGALRDVYVHGATLADWQAVLDHVRTHYPPLDFSVGGDPAALPAAVAEIFPLWERAAPLLYFHVGGIGVACHFFTPDEVEFDLRPEEVTEQARLDALVDFVRGVGDATGKPVAVTIENWPEALILRYDPATGGIETP